MKNIASVLLSIGLYILVFTACNQTGTQKDYPFQPINFTDVHITDQFWAPRMETNQKITIPYAINSGRLEWKPTRKSQSRMLSSSV
jgi:hypothetical protein